MKNIITKKIILGVTACAFIVSIMGFAAPQKAHAILGVGDIVFDLPNTLQSLLGELEGAVTAAATDSTYIQNSILNQVATAIAKQLLMQVTESVVNWINSGFNGNPAFIQNPTAFFQNIGDQATGEFISQNGALSSLCSPFSLQIRLAVAQQQQLQDGSSLYGANQSRYSCTLSTIIQNGTNAVNNASIDGFLGGDFNQGGWGAFSTIVTQPQNTPNGAYIAAEDQLQQQIAAQQAQKQNELNQGGGYLSWESCTSSSGSGSSKQAGNSNDPYGTAAHNNPYQTCTIQTPGSAISAALNKHLAVPTEELELANSINDVINAAFSELVVIALQKGLTSVSQSSNSGSSYLQSAVNGANQQSFTTARKNILTTITPYLATANTIDQNYSQALAVILAASSTIGQAESCYQTLLNSTTTQMYPLAITFIQGQITNLQSTVTTTLEPLAETMISKGGSASGTQSQYQEMYDQTINAKNLNDLIGPQQTLTTLTETGSFPNPADIQRSLTDLTDTKTTIQPIQQQATTTLNRCQSFSYAPYIGG